MSIPSLRSPDSSVIKLKNDGGKVWEDCWKTGEYIEEQDKVVRVDIKRQKASPGMCQKYQIIQPQSRKVTIYTCAYYEADKRASWLKKTLIFTGIVTGVVTVAGLVIVTAGTLGLVGVASGVLAISGPLSGLALSGAAFLPSGESIKDYERGKALGSGSEIRPDDWRDEGSSYEKPEGEPFPCVV